MQMWVLHNLAKEYSQRPSAIVGVPAEDSWIAYQMDVAVLLLGREVEGKLENGETLSKALDLKLTARQRARMGEFRSVKSAGKRGR